MYPVLTGTRLRSSPAHRHSSSARFAGGLLFTDCGGGNDLAQTQSSGMIDLTGVTQSWEKNLPVEQRFVVLVVFNHDAVLDKTTGWVWEKSPATPTATSYRTYTCINKNVGGQMGWQLPAISDLTSLIDPSGPVHGPFLQRLLTGTMTGSGKALLGWQGAWSSHAHSMRLF